MASNADILIYGGEAGGGKSFGLLLEVLYDYGNPGFGGAIFRRTSPQLTGAGSLWEDAHGLYRPLGAELTQSPTLQVLFPSGATLQFLHLQRAKDVYDHQGKQYAFIGFDELTHFEASQFWYLISRLRTVSGATPRVRGTTNPDPDSFVRKLIAWWIGEPDCPECQTGECEVEDHGYPNEDRCGVLRWFLREGDELVWFGTEEEASEARTRKGQSPMSLTFIRAGLKDNPALTSKDPGYEGRVHALGEVERLRLAGGNWNARPTSGRYIKAEYFARRWRHLPPLNIYICSDYAVTEPEDGKDPDYTEHGVFGIAPNDDLYVIDWWYGQTTSDVWIEKLLDLVKKHKPLCAFGEAGVIQKAILPALKKRMRERRVYSRLDWLPTATGRLAGVSGKSGYADRSKLAKSVRGRAFQARASMTDHGTGKEVGGEVLSVSGKILLPADENLKGTGFGAHEQGLWVNRLIRQCVKFPLGKDDAFDVMSHMCLAIDRAHPSIAHVAKPKPKRRDYGRKRQEEGSWKTS